MFCFCHLAKKSVPVGGTGRVETAGEYYGRLGREGRREVWVLTCAWNGVRTCGLLLQGRVAVGSKILLCILKKLEECWNVHHKQ